MFCAQSLGNTKASLRSEAVLVLSAESTDVKRTANAAEREQRLVARLRETKMLKHKEFY